MKLKTITPEDIDRNLFLRDLTHIQQGPHAMQILLEKMHEALIDLWQCPSLIYRSCPIVTVTENYDDLGYPPEGITRDARYTRYISATCLLRSHTSACIPNLLRALMANMPPQQLLICPGLVYRRDVIDRHHVGEPHQVDIWYLQKGQLTLKELTVMIEAIINAILPGYEYQLTPTSHPYTQQGHQIDIRADDQQWLEIGECGLADPGLLKRCGLDPGEISGLAMGLGLDRLLMIKKGIADIRLLRAEDPRVAEQMLTLEKYVPVSNQPSITRDLSIAIDQEMDIEELGDKVREELKEESQCIEHITILSETAYGDLPQSARQRMGIGESQKNALVRLVIRHPTRTLTSAEANTLRDRIYLALHQGQAKELCG